MWGVFFFVILPILPMQMEPCHNATVHCSTVPPWPQPYFDRVVRWWLFVASLQLSYRSAGRPFPVKMIRVGPSSFCTTASSSQHEIARGGCTLATTHVCPRVFHW
ncbi:hypothetical protein K443DRAFT_608869 [Laccaria amethystina LaAM-08-1]|uniref:Secreted protein n=1 Tax=Laccaria amethystina LaAM-08-1 TaxID=1095629 RepID=A0A0C9X794_9AGAR|nr:hypothetical protein K443DRAFT_608869 [Laccaria amethystina LaAM-08-1]